MRYVAAYLLAVLGGNNNPTAKNIKKILDSVGIDADDERVNKVISELSGKDVNDVVNSGDRAAITCMTSSFDLYSEMMTFWKSNKRVTEM